MSCLAGTYLPWLYGLDPASRHTDCREQNDLDGELEGEEKNRRIEAIQRTLGDQSTPDGA